MEAREPGQTHTDTGKSMQTLPLYHRAVYKDIFYFITTIVMMLFYYIVMHYLFIYQPSLMVASQEEL